MITRLYVGAEEIEAEFWVKKTKCFGENLELCWMAEQMCFLRPLSILSPSSIPLRLCFVTRLEKLLFSFPIKHVPAPEVRADLLSSAL